MINRVTNTWQSSGEKIFSSLLLRLITAIMLDRFYIFVKEENTNINVTIIVNKKQEDKYGL